MKKLLITALVITLPIAVFFIARLIEPKTVKIAYVEWAGATANSHVIKAVIEQETDYQVELTPVSAAAAYSALADGNQDALTASWLPVTHGLYIEKFKDRIINLGPNLTNARIGLVVPDYVPIDFITDLNDHTNQFRGKIIGIDPGAGIMLKTEKAIKTYQLNNYELIHSSGPMMTATLKSHYKDKEWIVVTGWQPHWKFEKMNLKFLKDPLGVFGTVETVNTFVRQGLKEEMPEIFHILDHFQWSSTQINELMAQNVENGKIEENARNWVKNHPTLVQQWLLPH